jgi:hypothetical protein
MANERELTEKEIISQVEQTTKVTLYWYEISRLATPEERKTVHPRYLRAKSIDNKARRELKRLDSFTLYLASSRIMDAYIQGQQAARKENSRQAKK